MRTFERRALTGLAVLVAAPLVLTSCFYRSHETEKVGQAPPPTVVVQQAPAQREYTYPQGRYELEGNGTRAKPYYWVWIPAGAQSVPTPPPPPLPQP